MATLTLRGLVKTYGNLEVVHAIDLEVADREFVALVGPSGCGKSTTLRMIAGLEEISSGTVEIDGAAVNHLTPRERNVAMVFQSYALYPHMTVRQNMSFSMRLARVPKSEIRAHVDEAARVLQLGPLLDRRPSELSGGQRQRVAMGRAIVRQPSLFLFDEPLSNLDAKLRGEMRAEIKRLHAAVESTMVYVTHDQIEAMTLADRIVIMRDGRIEQVGTPEEVFNFPASRFVAGFIGSPTMNLMDGIVAGDAIEFPGGDTLPLPRMARANARDGQAVCIGLRPDNVFPDGHGLEPGTPVNRAVRIAMTEPLGNETMVSFAFAGQECIARMLRPRPVRAGDTLPMTFDLSHAHLFDGETGAVLASPTS
jgi:multiple sugar transport system ATP-binding protein